MRGRDRAQAKGLRRLFRRRRRPKRRGAPKNTYCIIRGSRESRPGRRDADGRTAPGGRRLLRRSAGPMAPVRHLTITGMGRRSVNGSPRPSPGMVAEGAPASLSAPVNAAAPRPQQAQYMRELHSSHAKSDGRRKKARPIRAFRTRPPGNHLSRLTIGVVFYLQFCV